MASNSFLDSILSFFTTIFSFVNAGTFNGMAAMGAGLVFSLCEIWFGAVGWKRHRATGFLLFIGSGVATLVSHSVWIAVMRNSNANGGGSYSFVFNFAFALGFISQLSAMIGLGLFAYRAKFVSSVKPDFQQP